MTSGPHDHGTSLPRPVPLTQRSPGGRRRRLAEDLAVVVLRLAGAARAVLEPENRARGADAERRSICLLGGPSPLVGPPNATRPGS
jgi:hypothetical protein